MGYIQSVACRVLHAVEFSAIYFLQRIQQLKQELATLRREREEGKAAEVAAAAKKKRVSLAIWKATCLVCKQLSFHTEKIRDGGWPARRGGGRGGGGVSGGGGRRGGRSGGRGGEEVLHIVNYYQFKI